MNHEIIKKLEQHGIRGVAKNLLNAYLTERMQYVQTEGIKSDKLSVNHGVPQGSVLGPLLFLLYINDLPSNLQINVKLFADDAVLYSSSKNLDTLQDSVNKELCIVNKWLIAYKLPLKYSKTQYMMVSKRNNNVNNFRMHVSDIEIERVKKYKYLGVWLDEELSWKNHVQSLSSTLSKIAGVIYKIRNYVNFHCLKTLYYSLIQSKLIYGILAWGTTN